MQYSNIHSGIFLSRPNRFIAYVNIGGDTLKVHVKNTGRCRELLVPGAEVYLEKSDAPNRKTPYDLVAVRKGERIVNMDSQAPNIAAAEWIAGGGLLPGLTKLKREVKYGNSRFDIYAEYLGDDQKPCKAFIEVKGVTLENQNVASFPDAPTERGIKHIKELTGCIKDGYEAYLLFVIQMKDVLYFTPAANIHPDFANALKDAQGSGVKIIAYDCNVTEDGISLADPVEIRL